MNERVEEIKPISHIRRIRKLALRNPRRGRRELMYQFNRYHNTKKVTKPEPNKTPEHKTKSVVSPDVIEEIKDIKKRLAFDRAMIIGDES